MSVWSLFHSHATRQHFTEQEITTLRCFAFVFGDLSLSVAYTILDLSTELRVSLNSCQYSCLSLQGARITGGYPKHNSPSPQRCMSDSSQGQTLHS